jgi:aminopeptidase
VTIHGNLAAPAHAALECLGVRATDSVLVVCNYQQKSIADAFASAARPRARTLETLMFPSLSRHGEEPPAEIASAMSQADVVFAPTSRSLSQTQARIEASRSGTRIASLPTITEEIFIRCVAVDYSEITRNGKSLARHLTSATSARVTSPAGTEVLLSLEGRTALVDDGDLRQPGAFGNLPAGEAYIAPLERVGDGRIVFDGSLAGYGVLTTPLVVTLEGGRAVDADGEAGRWLLETLDAGVPTAGSLQSWASAPTRQRRSQGTCSKTRRSSAPSISPSDRASVWAVSTPQACI